MTLKLLFYIALLVFSILGYRYYSGGGKLPAVGKPAPDFSLLDQTGVEHGLRSFKGKWLVLYFYPKDDTPGCTKQACNFRDDLQKLTQLGAQIVGVSVDDSVSHAEFAKKYSLPFPLLADTNGKVAQHYGALADMGVAKVAKRYTFLIDPAGNIAKTYLSVDTSKHSQDIIDDLIAFQAK
jgi:thioredoxin-dependent peroxiredoxin